MKVIFPVLLLVSMSLRCADRPDNDASGMTLRIATFNIEDTRTSDVQDPTNERLRKAARVIQRLRPDILLVNELAVDYLSTSDGGEFSNARLFADNFLAESQGVGLEPLEYAVYQPETNTGIHSGMDLDNSGTVSTTFQDPRVPGANGEGRQQTEAGRVYGNDSWGFGTFPGQYGMAVFVRPGLQILRDDIRTFQLFKWHDLPGALTPRAEDGTDWYSTDEWDAFRLSSKTHAIVPVRISPGTTVNLLVSHPTPPAFDGPEQRNKNRNHDEIRLLRAIIDDAAFLVDDDGRTGGLQPSASFVVMGDLNADLDEGSGVGNPIETFLLSSPRVNSSFVPMADSAGIAAYLMLDRDDTAQFGLRVDYVLPSKDLDIVAGGVIRSSELVGVSDHFPVWVDVTVGTGGEH